MHRVLPQNLTWNLKIADRKGKTSSIHFHFWVQHVCFRGCIWLFGDDIRYFFIEKVQGQGWYELASLGRIRYKELLKNTSCGKRKFTCLLLWLFGDNSWKYLFLVFRAKDFLSQTWSTQQCLNDLWMIWRWGFLQHGQAPFKSHRCFVFLVFKVFLKRAKRKTIETAKDFSTNLGPQFSLPCRWMISLYQAW